MQKQRLLSAVSFLVVAVLLVAMGSSATAAPRAQATAAATMSAASIPGSGMVKAGVDAEAKRLNASGATFPLELYKKWAEEYKKVTGVEINYAGGGSGQGKKDISAQAVDFAGSDAFMTDDELKAAKGGELVHVATTLGAIVPIYNIPELKGKDLVKFTGDNLASIYLGDITK